MNKFKCVTCDHVAEKDGFCPEHGTKLVAVAAQDEKLEKLLGDIGALVRTETEKTLKDFGLDKANLPGKMFAEGEVSQEKMKVYEHVKSILSETDQKHLEALNKTEKKEEFLGKARIAYFFKNLVQFHITKDPQYLAHVKALAEGVDADGGYLTPPEFRAQLIEDLKDQPFLRNLVTVIPMSSDSLELPKLTNTVKTSWGSENTAISTTTASFGNLTMAPKRLNAMMYTSRELVADSALGIVQLITRLFIEAIGREEDRVILRGSGTGQPKGILAETLTGIDNGNDDATIASSIKKLPYRLPKAYRRNARWLASSLAIEQISALKDSTNNFLIRNLEGQGVDNATLAGYPIAEQNDMPVDTLLFGDFSFYFLGDRERVSVETTTEGAGTFEKHQVAIKVVERIDGKVALTNAFRTITNCGFD